MLLYTIHTTLALGSFGINTLLIVSFRNTQIFCRNKKNMSATMDYWCFAYF